jgi:hypothetical protein
LIIDPCSLPCIPYNPIENCVRARPVVARVLSFTTSASSRLLHPRYLRYQGGLRSWSVSKKQVRALGLRC